jgi:hypothetical protein
MPPPEPNLPDEAAAWAEVLAAWQDEERHRAYLARFPDLEGLAAAGQRYREALAARPDDPVAARFRDEVVKRATALGLAAMPRIGPPREAPRGLVRALVFLAAVVLGAALVYVITRIGLFAGAAP